MKTRARIAPASRGEVGLLAALWLALVALSLLAIGGTTLSTGEMAIWPTDAISLAFMLGPTRRRPVLTLLVSRSASMAVSLALAFPLPLALILNLGSIAGTWIAYVGLRDASNEKNIYGSATLVRLFTFSFLGSLISALTQSSSLYLGYRVNVLPVFESCFAATWVGYIVIVPLISTLYSGYRQAKAPKSVLGKRVLLLAAYTTIIFLATVETKIPLLFLIPLGLMGLAYLADLSSVALAVVATSSLLIYATVAGRGPIAAIPATPLQHLLMLQAFLALITTSMLPMAAVLSEHRRLRDSLTAARLEAESSNEAKSQFLAMISHEIRTPLNGILGMAQIMETGDLDGAQTERLQVIRRSGQVLLSILNDVLDLSKIDAGKLDIERIDFDLEDVLRSTTESYHSLAREKGLSFDADIGAVSGIYVGDPTRIRQIAANLLSNALKFTDKGSVSIAAIYTENELRLTVEDTGIGIPSEHFKNLFGKFNQADPTMARRFGGTGLGLAICRNLAALMGGRIDVASEVGRGSCFSVIIPLERVGEADAKGTDQQGLNRGFGVGIRVLAAEDNSTNQVVLRTLLDIAGFSVVVVGSGEEAVTRWKEEDWDIILMDVQMPGMDGPDASRLIRNLELATGRRRTPIIALTANTMSHQVQGYRASGMDGHVCKPIDAQALFKAMVELIEPFAPGSLGDGVVPKTDAA